MKLHKNVLVVNQMWPHKTKFEIFMVDHQPVLTDKVRKLSWIAPFANLEIPLNM